ncbi:MAG: hypothetical protein K2X27_23820 [Candidatus Obscuribacterales bacterium]|nr:hypothetical protein [Candidatus Obscuribacterales bacterium]
MKTSGASLIAFMLLNTGAAEAAQPVGAMMPMHSSSEGLASENAEAENAVAQAAPEQAGLAEKPAEGDKSSLDTQFNERELSRLEKRYFQHDFPSDSLDDRLSRLEQLILGDTAKGDFGSRMKTLFQSVDREQNAMAEGRKTKSPALKKAGFSELMSMGIANFKLQRYQHAQDNFLDAINLNPRSADAYANLGGTLLKLRDRQGAQDAFQQAYNLQPFGEMGKYAREKLLELSRESAYSNTAPQDTPTTVQRTVQSINRQCADRSRMYQAESNSFSRNRLALADIEIQKATAQTQMALADLRANRGYYTSGRYGTMRYRSGNSYDSAYDRQEISNLNYIRSSYLRTDGQVQSMRALQDGYNKAASVYESGTNLKDQLLQPVAPGGAKLRALGTNLYVRYYGDGLPSNDEPPLLEPPADGLKAKNARAY